MKTKVFHVGDVLSITTGRLVSPRDMNGVCDILGFMTEKTIFTVGAEAEARICKPHLLKQFPQLATPEMASAVAELDKMISSEDDVEKSVRKWFSKLTSGKYGIHVDKMLNVASLLLT